MMMHPLDTLRSYDSHEAPISPRWMLGRAYMSVLLVLALFSAWFGVPIPSIGMGYDILAYLSTVALVAAMVRPQNALLRRGALLFLCLSLGARAFYWVLVALGLTVDMRFHLSTGQALLSAAYPAAVAFGAVLVVLLTELLDHSRKLHGGTRGEPGV